MTNEEGEALLKLFNEHSRDYQTTTAIPQQYTGRVEVVNYNSRLMDSTSFVLAVMKLQSGTVGKEVFGG